VGLPSSVLDAVKSNMPINFWLSVFSYSFLYSISIIFFCWIAALCTSRLFTALLAALAVIWVYISLVSMFDMMFLMPTIKRMTHEFKFPELSQILIGLIYSKILIQGVTAVILGGGIIAYHYQTRRTNHVMIMSGVALIFILAMGGFWHKNIIPPSFISGITSQNTEIKKQITVFMESLPLFERSRQLLGESQKLINESQKLLNVEKPDPTTMAKDQAEVSARLAEFDWDTIAEVNFDDGKDESLKVKLSDPGLIWSVSNQCGRIAGISTIGKWTGGKIESKITNDTCALIEISGDFRIAKSSGYQLVALGCTTKAGSICMFFEGDKGTGCLYYKDKIMSRCGYTIQRRFIKIPVVMEKDLDGFEFGDETQAFHKMRITLDRAESLIYYHVDDQLFGILKYTGDIGTITSIWMDLETREKNTELDVLYDNLRARVAGDTYPD
jgi:hypothetical protein